MPQNNPEGFKLTGEVKEINKKNSFQLTGEIKTVNEATPLVDTPQQAAPGDDLSGKNPNAPRNVIGEVAKQAVAPVAKVDAKPNKGKLVNDYVAHLDKADPEKAKELKERIYSSEGLAPNNPKVLQQKAKTIEEIFNADEAAMSSVQADNLYKEATKWQLSQKEGELTKRQISVAPKLQKYTEVEQKIEALKAPLSLIKRDEKQNLLYSNEEELAVINKANEAIQERLNLIADPEIQKYMEDILQVDKERKNVEKIQADNSVRDNLGFAETAISVIKASGAGMLSTLGAAFKGESVQSKLDVIESDKKIAAIKAKVAKGEISAYEGATQMKDEVGYFGILQKLANNTEADTWLYDVGDQIEKEQQQIAQLNALQRPGDGKLFTAFPNPNTGSETLDNVVRNVGALGSRDFWAYDVPQVATSAGLMMAPGAAAYALASSGIGAPTGLAALDIMINTIGASTAGAYVSRKIEGTMEGGGYLQEEFSRLKGTINPVTKKEFTDAEIHAVVWPGYELIKRKNQGMMAMDALQFAIAFAPISKIMKLSSLSSLGKIASFAGKVGFEGYTERWEEDVQGLFIYQETLKNKGLLDKDAGTGYLWDDKFWKGYEEWSKTDEAALSKSLGMWGGILMGGGGAAIQGISDMNAEYNERKEWIDTFLTLTKNGNKVGLTNLQQKGVNNALAENAIRGTTEGMLTTIRNQREKDRVTMSDEENAKADAKVLETTEKIKAYQAAADPIRKLENLTKFEKKKLTIRTVQIQEQTAARDAHIAELQEKNALPQVVASVQSQYDNVINALNADIDDIIDKVDKGAKKKEAKKQRDKEFGDKNNQLFGLPTEAVDINETPEQRKQRELEVLAQKVDETTKAANKQRDNDLEDAYERTGYEPTAADVLSHAPDDYLTTLGMIENEEEVTEGAKAAAIGWAQRTKARLIERANNPNEKEYSSKILKGALAHIDNDLAVLGVKPIVATDQGFTTTAAKPTEMPTEIAGLKVIKLDGVVSGEEVFEVEGERFLTRDGKELMKQKVEESKPADSITGVNEVTGNTEVVPEPVIPTVGKVDKAKAKEKAEKKAKRDKEVQDELDKVNKNIDDAVHAANKRMGTQMGAPIQAIPELVKIAKGYFEKAAIVGKKGVYKANDFVDEFMANPKNKELIDRFKDNVEALKTKLRDAFREMMRGATTEKNEATEWRMQNDKKFAKEKKQEAKNKERKRKKKEKAGKFFSELEGEDSIEMETQMFDFLTQSGMENISDEAITEDYKKLIKRLGDITKDFPADKKAKTHKQLLSQMRSLEKRQFSNPEIEDMLADNFSEDDNYIKEMYAAAFSNDKQQQQLDRLAEMWRERNENGEIIPLLDENGKPIADQVIYDTILKHAHAANKEKDPSDLALYYALIPGAIGRQLAKQKNSDLITLHNNFKSTTRQKVVHLSNQGYNKESKTKSFLDILDSNGKHTDRELSNELIAQAYENEAAIKDKFSQKINEKGVNSYVTKRETIRAEIKAVMNKVDLIRTNRKDHPTGSTERNAINAKSDEIYEKEIKPLAAKLELLTADFLAEVTGIEQELWRGAIKKDAYAQKLYGSSEKPGYGANAKPVMQGFFIDIARSEVENKQGDMFFKLLAVGNANIKSQIKSLVQANIENLREAELIRNFKTIEGKTKNADMFKSYIEYHAEELTDPTVQKQHKDNLWAKEFATEAPSIVDAEGVSFTYTKNGKFKKVSTNDNAYVGDTLMTALVTFQSGKFARKGFYQQIFEQQAAFSNKLFIEAKKYSLSEATALLEKLGLINEPTIATDIKYVEQQIKDFTRKANGLNTNLSPAMAKEFVYNFVLNKHFLDMYFQPEINTKGQKNFGSYIEKVKRFQQGRGVQLNLDIMPEIMNMAVFKDAMAFVEIGGKQTKKLQEITDGGYLIREGMGNTIEKASGTLANYNNSIKATYTHHDKANTRTMIKGHGVVLTKELAETLDKYSGNNTMMRIYDYMNAHNVDILSFASSAKKFDQSMVNEMPWEGDSTVLSDKELSAPKMVDVQSKYFLIQQDLRQEGKFKEAGLTRQQFSYAQIFNSFPQIQGKFNDIIGRKFEDFQRDFINKDEDTQKEFLRKMLNSKSDKYDFLRRYLAKEDATLNNTYFQDQIQNLLTGHVANKVMKLDSFKNIATEFPLIGNALKPMRIEDGEIKPGEAFVPADYAQHHKEGDVVFITRVPSTWNHSLTPVKIMGFLPKSAGNILITDAGTQKLSGADNDGDQRHVWSKYPKDDITQDQKDMNDVFDLMMEEYTGKGLDQEELQERFADVSEPIDTKANEDMLKPHEKRMNKSASRYSIESQMKQIEANQDGQKTIAIGARFQAAFSLLDTFEGNLHVPVKIPAFGIDEKGNPVKGQDKIFTLGEFRAPTWKQRHDIKRILANFLNHSTDNPTLGKLGPMGINSETASLAYMLVSLGMDEESVYNYLNHPTVVEYARMSKEFSRPSSKYSRKDVWQKLADSFFDKTGEESNPFWDNEAKWADLYTNTNIDDAIGKTAEQKTQFLKQLKYLIGISNDIMELARIEKLTAEPIDSTFDYYRTLNSLQRFNNNEGKFAAESLFNSNHLDNASKVGLRAFRDFGKQYYPVMSIAGDQLFKRLKSIAKMDWEIMSKSNQEKLENGMQNLFLVNALDVTESKAVLAERAKKVYDGLPATNPLKKLLKWDADQNKLTVRVDFQSFMNESQKEEYRGAFQELREKQFSSMVSNREEQAEFAEKEKGMSKEQLAKSRQERQDSKINKWETLLHHQLAEYGWNYSPKFGEFSSFMDLGTHLYVGERMASEFAAWNKEDDEMDRSSMAQVNTMIKQLQLSMPDLIPTITVKKQKDGSVMISNVKGDLIKKDTSGYVIADINGEKRIYNAQDLMADGVNASHVSASSVYEMFPTDDFVDPTTTTKSTVTAPAATTAVREKVVVGEITPEPIPDEMFERIQKGATAIVTKPGTKGMKMFNFIKRKINSHSDLIGKTLILKNKDNIVEVKVKAAIQITSRLRADMMTGGNDEFSKKYYLDLKKSLANKLGITEQELMNHNLTDEWIITFEKKGEKKGTEEKVTNEVVPLDSTSPAKAEYQGAIVYATSSMGKSTLAAKYPEHITDFDALLATAFNEQMALLRGADYMVATADNVGDKIYTSYSIPGFNQPQMYQAALNEARKEAESGKTVLMGSKKYLSNADYLFQSTDDVALGKKLVRHNEDKSKEAQEREIKRFREGKDGENEMINASGMPVVKTERRIEDMIIDPINRIGGELEGSKLEEIRKGTFNADKKRMVLLHGENMYGGDIANVAIKELLQNSFDAIKAAQNKGLIKKGKIDIRINEKERTIEFVDNGIGMTPDIIQNAFFTIAGTNKDGLKPGERSGGLGMAKMAFIFSSKTLDIKTVRDGLLTTVSTTPESVLDDNFDIKSNKTDKPNGTSVKIKIAETTTDSYGKSKSVSFPYEWSDERDILGQSLLGDVEVTWKYTPESEYSKPTERKTKLGTPKENVISFTKATTNWGEMEIYFGTKEKQDGEYAEHEVLSSGLFQFRTSFGDNNKKIPFDIIINIKPNVGAEDKFYPFNNSREDFKRTVEADISALNYYLNSIYRKFDNERTKEGLNRMHTIDAISETVDQETIDKNLEIVKKYEVADAQDRIKKYLEEAAQDNPVIDAEKEDVITYSPESDKKPTTKEDIKDEKKEKSSFSAEKKIGKTEVKMSKFDSSKPMFHNNTTMQFSDEQFIALNKIATIVLDFKNMIANGKIKKYSESVEGQNWGITIDKSWGGVNALMDDFKFIGINPFYSFPEDTSDDYNFTTALAQGVRHLVIHEFNHNFVRSEGAEFTGNFLSVDMNIAQMPGHDVIMLKLKSIIKDNIVTLKKLNDEYHRPSTTNVQRSIKGAGITAANPGTTNTGVRDLLQGDTKRNGGPKNANQESNKADKSREEKLNSEWENGDLFDKPQSKNTKKPDRFTPAKKFSKALSQKLNVPHSWVTLEQAKAIRKNSTPIGDNEAAFYYNGNVYLIAGRVDENTQIHEFIHPLTNSIYVNNRPLFDKLWGDLVSTKEGLAIVDEIMQTSPELFKDGDPSVRGMLEIMTTAVEYEYANQQKNKTKKTGLAKIVQDIVDAIKSIIQKMMPELQVKNFGLDTTLGDLAKLMADDRRVNLKVDKNAMAGEPATKKFFEAIWDAPFEAFDKEGNAANEMREDDADEVYEQMIEVIETYYGKPIVSTVDLIAKKAELTAQFLAQKRAGAAINVPAMVRQEMLKYQPISVKEIAEVIDNKIEGIDQDRQKYKAEFDEWAWEHNIHNKNEAIRKTNADLNKVIDINDFTRQFMGEALDAALHRQEYNEKIIDKQYNEYVEAQALLKEIRDAYPNPEKQLYAAPLDDIYRYLRQLESYNEPYVWYVKQKLRRVYVSNWIHARLQSENNPNLTTREKRENGVAATYFFYQMMENALWKRDVPDIGFWEKWITSPLLMSDNATQFINHQNMEMKNTAVNHWSLATPAMLDAWNKIESMGIDPSIMITKSKSGITGEEQEVFIHEPVETRFTTKEKKAENRIMRIRLAQLERKAGSPEKAQAVLDFLAIHFKNMTEYSPYSKHDIRFYKVPQIKGDFMEIFNMSGLEGVVLKDMESDPYLDDIVIDTNEGDKNVKDGALQLTLAQARRIVTAKYLGKSSSGEKYSAATAATKNAIYTKRAKEILANAGESPYRVSLNAAGEIVVAPTENVGSGAPFAPTKYRSQNIGAILSQYYLGLFYKGAIESNMPAIMFARDWHNREKNPIATGNKNLANVVNDLVNYKVLGIQRQELSGAVTMIVAKTLQTLTIFKALGLNYAAQAGNLGAGLFSFLGDYGVSGYTLAFKKIAEMIITDIVTGTVKMPVTIVKGIMAASEKAQGDNYDPWDTTFIDFVLKETFKNTLKINNMIHNAGFINFQGNLGLSASARAITKFEQLAFLPMQIAESIIQFPQILYHLNRKELNMFDDDGNLKPGEKGLSTGKIAKILEELTRRNGPYTEHGKARYQYTTELSMAMMLKNWQPAIVNDAVMSSDIHGLKREPWLTTGSTFIPKNIYRSAKAYVKNEKAKPITGAEYVAFNKLMRIMVGTYFLMWLLKAKEDDDDKDEEKDTWLDSFIKRGIRAAAQYYGITEQQSIVRTITYDQTPAMPKELYEIMDFAGELAKTTSGDTTAYYQNERSPYGNKGDSKLPKEAADWVPFGSAIKQYRILKTAAERVEINKKKEEEKKAAAALKKNKLKPL